MAITHKWDAFRDVLSLLMHGSIIFPTYKDSIDSTTVSVFWDLLKEKENPILALLVDVFYTLHLRHEKRSGTLVCCLPLLYTWLTSHIFKTDVWINEMTS